MATQSMNLFCYQCGHETGHIKATTSHTFHLIMSLFTIGIWVVVWFLIAMTTSSTPKCSHCGCGYDGRRAIRTSDAVSDKALLAKRAREMRS